MSASPDLTVSVVIATHGRAEHLALTLDALERQKDITFEVVVVDDDSADDTPDLLSRRAVASLRVPRGGPGRARQAGWKVATGSIIAFTDDDCIPTERWLAELVAPIRQGDADFVQGRTAPRPEQLHLLGPEARTQIIDYEKGFYETCNIAYRRDVLEALGGFRADYVGPFTAGEDCDLGWRARKAGYRSAFVADALVHHEVWTPSYRDRLRTARRREMVVRVVRDHPEVRDLLYHRYFYRKAHLRFAIGIAGLVTAGAVRRWLPPLLVAGTVGAYLMQTRDRPEPPVERLINLGQFVSVQAVEIAAFARSSARHRTLLL